MAVVVRGGVGAPVHHVRIIRTAVIFFPGSGSN
jgi:hypothetical protein